MKSSKKSSEKKNVTLTRPAALAPKAVRSSLVSTDQIIFFFGVLVTLALLWGVTSYFMDTPEAITTGKKTQAHIRGRAKFASVEEEEETQKLPKKEEIKKVAAKKEEKKSEPTDSSGIALAVESKAMEVKDPNLSSLVKKKKTAKKKVAAKKTTMKKDAVKKLASPKKKISKPSAKKVQKSKTTSFEESAFAKAKKLEKAGDWKGALSQYNGVLYRNAKNSRALDGKIHALEKIASEGAIDVLDNLISRYPKKASVYAAKARVLLKFNDRIEAKKLMKKAVKLSPKNKAYLKELKGM